VISSRAHPPFTRRVLAVWYRHYRVYTKNLVSNGLPPFLEPLIFLAGIGLGMGKYVTSMQNLPYIVFLATGLPISANDLLIGEILWAGTKGLFFALAVISVEALFGIVPMPLSYLTGIVGFLTGLMFATIALLVTSFVSTINHFNFFFTGFLSPMFFFSGVVFPIDNLPTVLRPVAEIFPLTHSVRMARALDLGVVSGELGIDLICILGFTGIAGYFAIRRLKRKLIQ